MTFEPKDPKKPREAPPEEIPDSLPDVPERLIEEPGADMVPEEAPDVTPVPDEEVPPKMCHAGICDRKAWAAGKLRKASRHDRRRRFGLAPSRRHAHEDGTRPMKECVRYL